MRCDQKSVLPQCRREPSKSCTLSSNPLATFSELTWKRPSEMACLISLTLEVENTASLDELA